MNNRILLFSFLAFALPMGVLLTVRYDDFQEMLKIDPATTPGKVLYFTSPT